MSGAYYNEFDPKAAAWLREIIKRGLVADGEVDTRSIADVEAKDLKGFAQCHFFAGIGGWSYALRLAGWADDRPVWTGSCPCQPFSSAGKGKGQADERHLWPHFARLIRDGRPPVVGGEQVASAAVVGSVLEASFIVAVQRGDYARANKLAKKLARSKGFHYWRRWVDGVQADLAHEGYAFRLAVLGAHSVGAPHIRQRLWWVAHAEGGERGLSIRQDGRENTELVRGCATRGLADTETAERGRAGRADDSGRRVAEVGGPGVAGGLDNPLIPRPQGHSGDGDGSDEPGRLEADAAGPTAETGGDSGFWSDFDLIPCRDGKARRIEPGTPPLAHGVPARVVRLRGYGNAIVPQVGAAFVRAFMDTEGSEK